MSNVNKSILLADELAKAIMQGAYGKSGDRFPSTRDIAREKGVALVTAQRVMTILRNRGLIMIFGNAYYLTIGRMSTQAALYRRIKEKTSSERACPLIGIHVPQINNSFFSRLLKNLSVSIKASGYTPIIMCSNDDTSEERQILQDFVSIGVEGVISCPNHDASLIRVYENYILPVVFLANRFSIKDIEYTLLDNNNASRHIARHLTSKGYQHFAYIGLSTVGKDERLLSFVDELKTLGYDLPDENLWFLEKDDDFEIPYALQRNILKSPKPLGICCYHDLIAVQVLLSCSKYGINVPQDVGIVGFDNLPVTKQVRPMLTTVAYSSSHMARLAVNQLIQNIHSETQALSSIEYLNYVLHARQSTNRS